MQTWVGVDKGSGLPANLPVPSLLHESVDARNFPRLEVNSESYKNSNIKGDEIWYADSIRRMRDLGLLAENAAWSTASERYYTQVLKVFFENYHLDITTSGYELWLAWDWFAASNGAWRCLLPAVLCDYACMPAAGWLCRPCPCPLLYAALPA